MLLYVLVLYLFTDCMSNIIKLKYLCRKFTKCSPDVKCFLFKSYCSNLYCSILWYDCSKTALKNLRIAYNNSLRKLLGIPKYNMLLKCLFALTFLLLMSYLESMYILTEVDYWHPTTVFY